MIKTEVSYTLRKWMNSKQDFIADHSLKKETGLRPDLRIKNPEESLPPGLYTKKI